VFLVRLLLHRHSMQCEAEVSSVCTGWTTAESGSISGRGKRFSLFYSFQPISEAHQLSYRIGIGVLSRRLKRPRQAYFHLASKLRVVRVAQSVWRLATGWTVRGSNPGVGEIFRTRPDRPSLLYNGYRVLPGGKAAGAWY
jgi:hypothetical protein